MTAARFTLNHEPDRTMLFGAARPRALLGIALAYFMVLLDMTVLAVAESDLATSLHTAIAGLQWVTTGYTVVFASLLLSGGAVADRYGPHRVFRIGVTVFSVGSLASAAAPTVAVLVALRVVLGAAASACVPASMAMIARLYPDPGKRARAIAIWAAVSGAAVAAGPIAGGALVTAAGWRAIFLVNAPIAVLVLILTATRAVRCPRGDRRIDWPAQIAICLGLALFTDTIIATGAGSWVHAAAAGAGTAAAGIVFAVLERHSRAPVLNRSLLASGGVRAALAAAAAVTFALNGNLFVLALLFQQGRHASAVVTGLAFLPLTLPFTLNPPLTGRLVARFGPRRPILIGAALLTAGDAVLGWAVWMHVPYTWLGSGLLLTGLGVSFVLPALVSAVVGAAPEGTAGAAGGLLNAVRQVGATLGVAAMGTLLAAAGLGTGSAYALLLSALACAASGAWYARATKTATPVRSVPPQG